MVHSNLDSEKIQFLTCSKKYLEANIEHVNFHSRRLSFSRNLAAHLLEGWLALGREKNVQTLRIFIFGDARAPFFNFSDRPKIQLQEYYSQAQHSSQALL